MSVSSFYVIIIAFATLTHSGMCFRCYVCNSNINDRCYDKPSLIARCPYSTTGCVKLVNQMVEYKFVNSIGEEIASTDWDGRDTNWEPIPYVKKVVTRRCGNNYARYQPRAECRSVPLTSNKYNETKEIICYCKTELCNGAGRSKTNKFLNWVSLIFILLYVSKV